ncbi:MAG: Ribosomal large subunit pseudouridine synthase B [Lentisphaerae bacterium ADurb.Bin082]|nr:MAG: Ribosomal large subunit pseudouridine synthase B [Lentisphaerae bacterium ADurb.Bin082]
MHPHNDSAPAPASMRLARYLASAGIASRRRCEELIREGRVSVNGQAILTPVCIVTPGQDVVRFEGRILTLDDPVYLMLNKPVGYTCSAQDKHAERLVYDLLPENLARIFSVGRLDRDSEGLLILTNDGDLAQNLTHPSRQIAKHYIADCAGMFTQEMADNMVFGVEDDGDFLKASQVILKRSWPDHVFLEIVLTEGKKREVRRLCASQGLTVTRLARVQFASLKLGDLPSGKWRRLTPEEINDLKQTAATPV